MKRRKQNDYQSINMLLLIQLRKTYANKVQVENLLLSFSNITKFQTITKNVIKRFCNFYNNEERFINICISTRYVKICRSS